MKVSNNEFTKRELLEKLGFKAVKEYEIEESLNQKQHIYLWNIQIINDVLVCKSKTKH